MSETKVKNKEVNDKIEKNNWPEDYVNNIIQGDS